jgi:phospholipid/cholesterol/gamma-HCH transport system ATP-binding protein
MESGKGIQEEDLVVKIRGMKKSFGEKIVLKDVSLEVKKGENLVILGKSGSGKSVLIKCLVRLMEPDDGEIFVFNKNMLELNEDELNKVRKRIGFLFQSGALYDSMTVGENLEFPLRELRARDRRNSRELVEEALENVGLSEAINKMPSELSGGMRKRIGLARTLMLKPSIILYDEPTTGLDPITSRGISQLILNVQKKYNAASIIITHDLDCARRASNRVIVLSNGVFIADGTYDELTRSEDKAVRDFFE